MAPPRTSYAQATAASKDVGEPFGASRNCGTPVVSVMRGVLTNAQPPQAMPLGLAMTRSAREPYTSMAPLIALANASPRLVTSLMMTLAARPLSSGLAPTAPPSRVPPPVVLLLMTSPPGSTLN
jgi:hypothetical protein